ncbi:hypothetical protein tb265_46350 [Gemmatimonadetes bacterium T265]|nr:hypothetical protein tb265_46350 [Gemmatimonadetes bacterium T265]
MTPARRRALAAGLAAAVAACAPPAHPRLTPALAPAAPAPAAASPAAADGHTPHDMGAMPGMGSDLPAMAPVPIPAGVLYTEADVRFLQHMIAHHAQAIAMSRLAVPRAANPRLLRLAQKIDQSQAAEIATMQQWLRANGQAAPDTASWHTMTMAGMLTPAQMAELGAARGAAFDRLFLTGMIRHHEGALRMVADLFAAPRAAQDVDVSVLANDVETTQTAEIAVMRRMLAEP